jgi:hypothetical protein
MSPPTVAVLLAHGANPNAAYNSATPWQKVLLFAYSLQSFKMKTNFRGNEKLRPDREEIMRSVCLFRHFIDHGADLTRSCNCGATTRDVLWIVEEVLHRWEPEESEALLEDLRRRMASAGMVSRFSLAWKKVRNYLTTDTTGCGIHRNVS